MPKTKRKPKPKSPAVFDPKRPLSEQEIGKIFEVLLYLDNNKEWITEGLNNQVGDIETAKACEAFKELVEKNVQPLVTRFKNICTDDIARGAKGFLERECRIKEEAKIEAMLQTMLKE